MDLPRDELAVLMRRLDATRGDRLSLGVSPPEDNSWRSMFSLGDSLERDEV